MATLRAGESAVASDATRYPPAATGATLRRMARRYSLARSTSREVAASAGADSPAKVVWVERWTGGYSGASPEGISPGKRGTTSRATRAKSAAGCKSASRHGE